MNKIYRFCVFAVLFLFASCIPNKDLLYLQNKNNSNQEQAITPVVLKPYRAQVNDVLSIRIKALDQKLVEMFNTAVVPGAQINTSDALYFDGFSVNDHGDIRVPVLGIVNVIGLTLDEIRLKIEKQLLEEYFNKSADIFVTVKLAGMRYTVNGEVVSPGTKVLFQDKVTILEAIANCGDITITGNRKDVMVVRQYPNGTEMHTIDLTSSDALKSPYYYIQPNDFIYIKPLKQKSWGTGTNGLQSFTTILSSVSLLLTIFLLLKK
ncbi:MAG: polysaccharide biosynthesis/export family protein [Flavobacterium sp.]|uniref:polysaccharide biosynthesis/export family protein n=1 Tax=Flavobacterium sp. TaxID=239 RepID=UPI003266250A